MPKKVNISSNERIDLEDFQRTSSEYTLESDNFSRAKLLQARHSVIAGGFRIELSNQTTNPGEFTLFNGLAVNQDGGLLNNEQQVNDARILTLVGAGSTFYVEIELTEAESDVDSRAFWDPTFSGNTPKGREFSLNVATRLTPDWQIPTPVSTTGFEIDTISSSLRIPIAVLTLNGSNEITGVSAVNAATVLEEDILAAALTLQVLDSTIFPDTGTADLGVGTANVESVTITANDRTTGTITIFPASINTHSAGAILRQTGVTATFVPETSAAVPTTGTDRKRMLFKGDETRGSALSASKESAIARSDQDLKSLKDHIDFLAAQIREMKFGDLRPDVNSSLPPTSADYASARYFDYAGSILGAKTHAITVGDTVLSYGDLNSTSSDLGTIIQQAHDSLDATAGGSIYIKAGNYVFDATVTVDRPIRIEFDPGATFVAGAYASTAIIPGSSDLIELIGFPPTPDLEDSMTVSDFTGIEVNLILRNCNLGTLLLGVSLSASTLFAENCIFNADRTADAASHSTGGYDKPLVYKDCEFRYINTSFDGTRQLVLNVSDVHFFDCTFDISQAAAFSCPKFVNQNLAGVDLVNAKFDTCKFISSNTGRAVGPFDFGSTASSVGIDGLHFKDCLFDFTFGTTTLTDEHTVLLITQTTGSTVFYRNIIIEGCNFAPMADQTIAGATAAQPYRGIALQTSGAMNNCRVTGCSFGEDAASASGTAEPNHYTRHIELVQQTSADAGDALRVSDNYFAAYDEAVYIVEASANVVNNTFWYHYTLNVTPGPVRAVSAIGLSSRQHLVVSGNNIDHIISSIVTLENIGVFLGSFDGGNATITGNHIECQNVAQTTTAADAYGIYLSTGNPSFVSVSGNNIKVVTQAGDGGCIFLISNAITGESTVFSVTGNTCEADSNSNVHLCDIYGMFIANGATTTDQQPSSVSGNSILIGNRAAAGSSSVGDYFGIRISGTNFACSSNSIIVIKRIATGILSTGQIRTIDGNTIKMLNGSFPTGFDQTGIFLDGAIVETSNVNVTGNTIYGEDMMKWGIEANGFSGVLMKGINVTGNEVRFSCNVLTPNGGIRLRTAGFGGGSPPDQGGWNISGNTLVEGPDNAGGGVRGGIEVIGNGGPSFSGNVVVGNNNIFGEDSYASRTGRAIYVEGFDNVVVNGNGIRRFTSAVTTEIEINDCSTVTVTSNSMEQNQISANLIRFTSASLSVYDNNVAIPTVAGTHCLGTAAAASSGLGNLFANTGVLS